MRPLLPAALVLVALAGREATANPCQPLGPGGGVWEVAVDPAGGTVPTNVRLRVTYDHYLVSAPYLLALLDDAGAPVDVAVEEGPGSGESILRKSQTSYFLTPRSPLSASSRYTLVDRLRLGYCTAPPPSSGAACEGEPLAIATFETGPGPDTAPPTTTRASVETSYAAPSYDSCQDHGSVWHSLTVDGVEDEQPASTVRFNVYDAAGRLHRRQMRNPGSGHGCYDEPSEDDIDEFIVRAVDMAGNEETEGHRLRGRSCASFEDGSGCHAAGGAAGLLVGLAALGLRRRRR
jgi:hypothetical protein